MARSYTTSASFTCDDCGTIFYSAAGDPPVAWIYLQVEVSVFAEGVSGERITEHLDLCPACAVANNSRMEAGFAKIAQRAWTDVIARITRTVQERLTDGLPPRR